MKKNKKETIKQLEKRFIESIVKIEEHKLNVPNPMTKYKKGADGLSGKLDPKLESLYEKNRKDFTLKLARLQGQARAVEIELHIAYQVKYQGTYEIGDLLKKTFKIISKLNKVAGK